MAEIWLTKQETAARLQVSEKTVDRLWEKGILVREMRSVVGKGILPHFRLREIETHAKLQTGHGDPNNRPAHVVTDTVFQVPADGTKLPDADHSDAIAVLTIRVEIRITTNLTKPE